MLFDRAATSAELFKHANHERRPPRWSFEKSGGGDSRAWRDVRPQAAGRSVADLSTTEATRAAGSSTSHAPLEATQPPSGSGAEGASTAL